MDFTLYKELFLNYSPQWYWLYVVIAFVLSAGLTAYAIPVIIHVAQEKQLVDDPAEARKLHIKNTPLLGGLAIFISLVTVFAIIGPASELKAFPLIIGGMMLLFTVGLKDDLLLVAPMRKLLAEVVAGGLLFADGIRITNLGGLLGIESLPGLFSLILTILAVVVIINAYNLIDGIDGLAASIGILISGFFGFWYWTAGYMATALLAFTLTGALLGFLWYNFHPARIFMGDAGSLVVGFLLAVMAIRFVDISATGMVLSRISNVAPVYVMAVLIVPLYDIIRVFILRIARNSSPFEADRDHVHHQLLDMGFSQEATVFILCTINLAFIVGIWMFSDLGVNVLLIGTIAAAMLVFPTNSTKRAILWSLGYTVVHISRNKKIKIMSFDKMRRYYENNSSDNPGANTEVLEEFSE